jgi:hypothetical protein
MVMTTSFHEEGMFGTIKVVQSHHLIVEVPVPSKESD